MELGTWNTWDSFLSIRETACGVQQLTGSAAQPC